MFIKVPPFRLPKNSEINKIKYFTAKVSGLTDKERPLRQQIYIKAIKHYIPNIEIIYGQFKVNVVSMPLETPNQRERFVRVIKTEEKGTDVNIAVNMLNDAWEDDFDLAILISNDSDLAEAVRLVKNRKKHIGLFLPNKARTSKSLLKNADFIKRIRSGVLINSQLPSPIPDTNIYKPQTW